MMRTHDEEAARAAPARAAARPDRTSAAGLSAQLLHLQRVAGNASVARILEEDAEARSPVHQVIGGGGGQALDSGTQAFMESRLGADFSSVRIHIDAAAAESARAVNARAYTVGNDIVFGAGQYQPGSPTVMRTLAHELTHVVQQRAGAVDGTPAPGGIRVSDPSDRFERAADASAERVMSSADELESVQTVAVQRQAEHEDEEESEEG